MSSRELILQKATELLAASFDGDVSTRAVCEAAGVGQPILYRNFGDKDGLLAAVVDRVWSDHLASKRDAAPSEDPVEDLRRGWDDHTAFALANANAYRLLFGTRLATVPAAMDEAMTLLTEILERCADRGRLRVAPSEAARIVMAANSGIALALILRSKQYPKKSASDEARDAVLRGILVDAPTGEASVDAVITMRARLADADDFTPGEQALMREWLTRIQTG